MLTSLDIGWIAGFLEGEGCFTLSTRAKYPHILVTVTSTDEDTLEKLNGFVRHSYVNGPYKYSINKQPIWRWALTQQKEVAGLLMTIYPLMSERRQLRILELLTAWRSFPYMKDRPCVNGHLDGRYSNGACITCSRKLAREYSEKKRWGLV